MVGTRFVCALTGKLPPEPHMRAGPKPYRAGTIWQEERHRLGYVKYDSYPISSFETRDFFLYLEGRLYGLSDARIQSELRHLAHLATSPMGGDTSLANWLRDTDGDFLIVVFHKPTNTISIINDLFARLPTYYHLDRNILVISRDIDYVREQSGKNRLDPMSLAQYLVFGFPLGPRTLFEGIYVLPPASLITIEVPRAQVSLATLVRHNLENKEASPNNISHNAGHLVELFRIACRHRAAGTGPNVVSLSGGLDSRAVAAGLRQDHHSVAAATFLDHQGDNRGDFQVARQVAAHLRLPWYSFQLSPPREQEVNTLLHLKQGANNLEMSFILDFLTRLQKTFGADLTYFTGDGGGDTLGESRPFRRLPSPASLLDYLIERYQIFPLETAASLTGVPAKDLADDLADLLSSYPETTPARKYQHFFCLEVAIKQYNEGEDRNRQYFWSVTPFYSPRFFTYALSCPDRQKLGFRLYRQFLGILSPGLDHLPYADWGAPLGSWKFALLYAAKNLSRMRPALTRSLKLLLHLQHNHTNHRLPSQALKRQVLTTPSLGAYFSESGLMNLIQNIDTLNIGQRWTLFTLTSLAGEMTARSQA